MSGTCFIEWNMTPIQYTGAPRVLEGLTKGSRSSHGHIGAPGVDLTGSNDERGKNDRTRRTGWPSTTDPETISLKDAVERSSSRCSHARCSLPKTSQKGESCCENDSVAGGTR